MLHQSEGLEPNQGVASAAAARLLCPTAHDPAVCVQDSLRPDPVVDIGENEWGVLFVGLSLRLWTNTDRVGYHGTCILSPHTTLILSAIAHDRRCLNPARSLKHVVLFIWNKAGCEIRAETFICHCKSGEPLSRQLLFGCHELGAKLLVRCCVGLAMS